MWTLRRVSSASERRVSPSLFLAQPRVWLAPSHRESTIAIQPEQWDYPDRIVVQRSRKPYGHFLLVAPVESLPPVMHSPFAIAIGVPEKHHGPPGLRIRPAA